MLDGEAYGRLVRLASASKGLSFSLVGEIESSCALSIVVASASRTVRALGLSVAILSKEGEDRPIPSAAGARLMRFEVGEGVFTGDDFWGEIDLARSVVGLNKQVSFGLDLVNVECDCLLECHVCNASVKLDLPLTSRGCSDKILFSYLLPTKM